MKLRFTLVALALLALTAGLQTLVTRARTAPAPATERCADCHTRRDGLEPSHATLGCAQCHLGDPRATERTAAHVGLARLPGNFSNMQQTCGATGCHVDVPTRLQANIMSTMNGVVSVDRWVFGEQPTPTAVTPVTSLGVSPADLHLRNLCASCHLGAEKRSAGPITEATRGGGCLACHLASAGDADAGLHATLRALPHPLACTGCHARSGRISLNYEGWHELTVTVSGCATSNQRVLEDGRCVERRVPDVHFEAGLVCVDCHGSWEVMGDGRRALHREDQSTVRCDDCHTSTPRTRSTDELDPESRRLVTRRFGEQPPRRWVTHAKSDQPLVNSWLDDGGVWVRGKASQRTTRAKPTSRSCARNAHRALACATCHSAWAPQCVQCHTRFDPDGGMVDLLDERERGGEWIEQGGPSYADPPTLGVRESDAGREVIPFTPGMVLTIDGAFHRLYAPASPHTTRREVRSCASCHLDPLALGYGRGALREDAGTFTFTPTGAPLADGLPDDAWVGFLATPTAPSTTRENTRPFTVPEQRRVLQVGVCLRCHAGASPTMQAALDDFAATIARRGPRCRKLP